MTAARPIPSRCPRCGYDQRGVIATWNESCPLHGVCSECGLQFIWADVLVPAKFEPQWCVEFVPRVWRVPMAACKTFAISFWPWKFWSRMKMSQPIRWRRLASYLLFLLVPLLLGYVVAQGTLAARMRYVTQQQYTALPAQVWAQLRYEKMHLDALNTAIALKTMTEEQRAAALAAAPAGFALGPNYGDFLHRLSQSSDEILGSQIQSKQRTITSLQAQINTPPKILISYPGVIFEAICKPLARWSSGSIQLGDGTVFGYPAPIELYDLIGSVRSGTASWSDDVGFQLILTVISILGLVVLMPTSFVLLPASRRRAKVRWGHVVRIFVYSMFALACVVLVMFSLGFIYLLFDNQLALIVFRGIPLPAWIAITIWWAVAIKRYLKMPHAGAVAGIMSLMLALLMSPLLVNIFPRWMVGLVLD